jgi:hypothetical protein
MLPSILVAAMLIFLPPFFPLFRSRICLYLDLVCSFSFGRTAVGICMCVLMRGLRLELKWGRAVCFHFYAACLYSVWSPG